MNRRILVLCALAFCACISAEACWYCMFSAKHYLTYRVVTPENQEEDSDEDDAAKNCALWQRQTAAEIPADDIRQVVYAWSAEKMRNITPQDCDGNKFAQWIAANGKDAAEYLILAKEVEAWRREANDPWYYPYEGDELSTRLQDACERARAGMRGWLHDRYMLQLVRALKTLRQDKEIIGVWKEETVKEPLMHKMIGAYVAGAYYAGGQYDEALKMYGNCGDATSIRWCLKAQGCKADQLAVIDQLAGQPGNYRQVMTDLQHFVTRLEIRHEDGEACEPDIDRLIYIAHKHATKAPARHKALWHYTEAYAHWLKDDMGSASKAIVKAEAATYGQCLKKSAHVLRLLIESRMRPADASYDAWLHDASLWMIEQAERGKAELYGNDGVDWDIVTYFRNVNQSHYYYTDMLRKMAIGYAVPKLMEAGDTVRALQVTDMADHVLMPDETKREISSHDNATFAMADTLPANTIIRFVERINSPEDQYDAFYNHHGSGCNRDYWHDMAGTLLLRETRYEESIPWLEKVSGAYLSTMFVLPYCDTNPFALPLISDAKCHQKEVRQPIRKDYRLWFAKKMAALKQAYPKERNANKRAMMQLQFAVGMRNSVYPCWPLTQYYWGNTIGGSAADIGDYMEFSIAGFMQDDYWAYRTVNHHERQFRRIRRQSAKLMDEALATFTDKETLASVQWAMGNYKTVKRHLSDTRFAKQKRGQCDRWKDY